MKNSEPANMWISQRYEKSSVIIQFALKNNGRVSGDYMTIVECDPETNKPTRVKMIGENDGDVVNSTDFSFAPEQETQLFNFIESELSKN